MYTHAKGEFYRNIKTEGIISYVCIPYNCTIEDVGHPFSQKGVIMAHYPTSEADRSSFRGLGNLIKYTCFRCGFILYEGIDPIPCDLLAYKLADRCPNCNRLLGHKINLNLVKITLRKEVSPKKEGGLLSLILGYPSLPDNRG